MYHVGVELMSARKQEVYDAIVRYVREENPTPTVGEIADAVGIKTKSNAHHYVRSLVDRGILTMRPHKARSIRLADQSPDDLAASLTTETARLRAALEQAQAEVARLRAVLAKARAEREQLARRRPVDESEESAEARLVWARAEIRELRMKNGEWRNGG